MIEDEVVEALPAEDDQADIMVEAEDSNTAGGLIQEAEEPQTDELTDNESGSVVDVSVDAENSTVEMRFPLLAMIQWYFCIIYFWTNLRTEGIMTNAILFYILVYQYGYYRCSHRQIIW